MKKESLLRDTDTILNYLFFLLPKQEMDEIDNLIGEDEELLELFTGLSTYCFESDVDKQTLKKQLECSKLRLTSSTSFL